MNQKGYLNLKQVYISGAIEADNSNFNWRELVKKVLKEQFNLDVFDPFSDAKQNWGPTLKEAKDKEDWETVRDIARRFVRKDLSVVDCSDFVIARARHDIPTVGTWHEVINAWNAKKPVLLVNETGKKNIPAWLHGFVYHKYMFGSWVDLYSYLKEVDEGKHQYDFRWSYVYGLI